MNAWQDDMFEMSYKMVALVIRFPEQNKMKLSGRAKKKKFKDLIDGENLND